jgi:hypothetical protein
MPNIKKQEVEFLRSLVDKIENCKDMEQEAFTLQTILNRLDAKQEEANKRTLEIVTEKREQDPCYGRSKEEKERIKNRKRGKK